jgi:hypothetical protein
MQRNGDRRRHLRTMDLAGILLGAILAGGFIAIGTGIVAIVGLLQVVGAAGIQREPPVASGSITARERAVDARLRARYLERHAARPLIGLAPGDPADEPSPADVHGMADSEPDALPAGQFAPDGAAFSTSAVDPLAG